MYSRTPEICLILAKGVSYSFTIIPKVAVYASLLAYLSLFISGNTVECCWLNVEQPLERCLSFPLLANNSDDNACSSLSSLLRPAVSVRQQQKQLKGFSLNAPFCPLLTAGDMDSQMVENIHTSYTITKLNISGTRRLAYYFGPSGQHALIVAGQRGQQAT